MKKLLPFALSITFALPVSAQRLPITNKIDKVALTNGKHPKAIAEHYDVIASDKKKGSQVLSSNVVDKLFNAFSYLGKTVPLVFEPKSGMYVKIQRGADEETRGNLYISGSTDNGKTWSEGMMVYDPADSDGDQARYPSIQVTNPTGSSKIEDFDYTIFAPVLRSTNKVTDFFNGFNLVFKKGNTAPAIFPFSEPEIDNKDLMTWGTSSSIASDESKSMVYLSQMLNTRNIIDTSRIRGQYGTYGFLAANTSIQEATGNLPSAWSISQFPFQNEGGTISKESSYNTNIRLDIDSQGALYAAVINFWIPDQIIEDQRRYVGVSKSTDQGLTWSSFEKVPHSVLLGYLAANNADTTLRESGLFGSVAYHDHGFVVTGSDEFSYIYPFTMKVGNEKTRKDVIAQVYKKSGVWGMRTVAEYTGTIPPIFEQMVNGVLTPDTSSRGNEIQLAKTLDGKHLVAKWIDRVNYTVEEQEISSFDIFVSVFDIETQTWSEKRNVTNDAQIDKLTWLPQTLPSITEIPVLSIVNDSENPEGTLDYLNDQMRLDLTCSVVSKVFNPLTVSVQEQPLINNASLSVVPNPVNEQVEIGFSLSNSSFTTVTLVNSLGETVKQLFVGQLDAGQRGFYADLSNVSSGTYLVNITTNSGTITTPIVVVH